MFFNDASIVEDTGLVSFQAPDRAEDAALVPMSFSAKLPEGDKRRVVKLTLVIDQNPVPLAATFTLGEKAGNTRISTRVRVNSYTNTRVVAEADATARCIWRRASSRRQAGVRRRWPRAWMKPWRRLAR